MRHICCKTDLCSDPASWPSGGVGKWVLCLCEEVRRGFSAFEVQLKASVGCQAKKRRTFSVGEVADQKAWSHERKLSVGR